MTKTQSANLEFERRVQRFHALGGAGHVALAVTPAAMNDRLNDVRVFYGGRGIWYDADRTRDMAPPGITVGVLHAGRHYEDDLAPDGIVYHYPSTDSTGKDKTEVHATKNAAELGLPIFVAIDKGSLRDVYLGWVQDWDDADETFLIVFADVTDSPRQPQPSDEIEGWQAIAPAPRRRSEVVRRERDPRFAFHVKKRYGATCAACGLSVKRLVDAAHVIPVAKGGSNHPANGLPLCPTHHRVFDNHEFGIEPHTLALVALGGASLDELRITRPDIAWLPAVPHPEALEWRSAAQSS